MAQLAILTLGLRASELPSPANPSQPTPGCASKFASLFRTIGQRGALATGRATRQLPPQAYELFERIRLNHFASLSADELAFLNREGLQSLLEQYRSSSQWVKDFNHWLALRARSQPQLRTNDPMRERIRRNWLRATLNGTNLILAPGLPLGPTEKLRLMFARALRDPAYVPSTRERDFLKRWNFEADFDRFRREALNHQGPFLTLTNIRQSANYLRWGVIGVGVAGLTVTPELMGETITFEEDERLRTGGDRGNSSMQLYYSEDDNFPPLIRMGRTAFVFEMGEVKFLNEAKLLEFEKNLRTRATPYNRVILRGSAEARTALRRELVEYVSRRRRPANASSAEQQEFVKVNYLDLPMGELYKILQRHLALPPLPILSRNNAVVTSVLGMAAQTNNGTGAVAQVHKVGERAAPEVARDIASRGFNNYLNALLMTTPTAALPLGGGLWFWDSRPHNRLESVHALPTPKTSQPVPTAAPYPAASPTIPEPPLPQE